MILAECEAVGKHIDKIRDMVEQELETPLNYKGSLRGKVDDYLACFKPSIDSIKDKFQRNRNYWINQIKLADVAEAARKSKLQSFADVT